MKLYIRDRTQHITYLETGTVKEFFEYYESLPDKPALVLGDINLWNKSEIQSLLILLETYTQIDCYTSKDILSPIMASRFKEIIKAPLPSPVFYEDNPMSSYQDFYDSRTYNKTKFLTMKSIIKWKSRN